MYAGKPVIGLVGGIGSGKSFVAKLFGERGCLVVDSDAQVREAYRDPSVLATLRQWWGPEVALPDGTVNRSAIAARVFSDPEQKRRLEGLIHPLVHAAREREMAQSASLPQVVAYVWDTPLLLEVGLADDCDAVVFVDTPFEIRRARARQRSGWDADELLRREKSQMPLDTKRALSDYVVANTADAGSDPSVLSELREQVRRVLSQILSGSTPKTPSRDHPSGGSESA
jgi:dephospho-CoA kinase